jgi:hypothetical protein
LRSVSFVGFEGLVKVGGDLVDWIEVYGGSGAVVVVLGFKSIFPKFRNLLEPKRNMQ